MKHKKWTDEQLNFLKENYLKFKISDIAKKVNHPIGSVYATAQKIGLSNKFRPRNVEDLSSFWRFRNPIFIYLLGFLWADGYIRKDSNTITIHISESDGIKLKNIVSYTGKWRIVNLIGKYEKILDKKYMIFSICNFEFKKFLVECDYNIKSGASACKILSKIPNELKHYWWRGYLDGDGCIYCNDNGRTSVSLTSTIDQNWIFAIDMANKIGADYKIRLNKSEKGGTSIFIFQRESSIIKFCEYIYQGETFGLERKRAKYIKYIEYKKFRNKEKTSRYKGVSRSKNEKWIMQINNSGNHIHKEYLNELDAAREYDRLAKELLDNKAVLNFPHE